MTVILLYYPKMAHYGFINIRLVDDTFAKHCRYSKYKEICKIIITFSVDIITCGDLVLNMKSEN